jgi:hypothetical protein
MSQFGYDLPDDDAADEPDGAEALRAAEAEAAAAQKRLADLQRKHGATTPPKDGKQPEAGQVDLDALLAKVSDRSRPWPDIETELVQAGFRSSTPAPTTRGIRPGRR